MTTVVSRNRLMNGSACESIEALPIVLAIRDFAGVGVVWPVVTASTLPSEGPQTRGNRTSGSRTEPLVLPHP